MPSKRASRIVISGILAICAAFLAHFSRAAKPPVYSDLTVHEWGTFTSIAGNDGRSVRWLPLNGSEDLPGFVEHFREAGFKAGLSGTVRMETPVMYFYAAQAMKLSVKVSFAKGVITEWYPHASRVEPTATLTDASLYQKNAADGSIAWDSITVDPGISAGLPLEKRNSRYYAARETTSTPLRVATDTGGQQEKFLFYRGVSVFPVPVSAGLSADGDKVLVKNLGEEAIPNIIRFERRGDRLGYSIKSAVQSEEVLDAPELTGTLDSLDRNLVDMLVNQGLYLDEAQAMVRTWNDSWFEEGSRLIYIVPPQFVDTILPLSINPAPAQTVRVFVGRLELVTPATEKEVETAFRSGDDATLQKFGRFLDPILEEMMKEKPYKDFQSTVNAYFNSGHSYSKQN
jgi:hypothetical protein